MNPYTSNQELAIVLKFIKDSNYEITYSREKGIYICTVPSPDDITEIATFMFKYLHKFFGGVFNCIEDKRMYNFIDFGSKSIYVRVKE